MGIQQTKNLLKTYYSKVSSKDPDNYLQKVFCPEALHLNEFLENFWDPQANEYFDWTNIQENKKIEEINKEKEKFYLREKYIIPELPLNPTITDNLFSIEPIAEYKEALNPNESKYFSNTLIKRMHIILIAYVRNVLSTYNENSTLECIAQYFESIPENSTGLEIGMGLFIKMLDDIAEKNIKIKEETLDFLVGNSMFIRPLAFWGETKKHFVLDKSLNEIVTYLKKIVKNNTENPSFRQKAYKVLLNLGLAKGSLRNLLDFVDYYKYIDEFMDFNFEFNLFKNEFIKLSLSYPISENIKVKSKLWGFNSKTDDDAVTNIKTAIINTNATSSVNNAINPINTVGLNIDTAVTVNNKADTQQNQSSLTNDGSYIYLFSSIGYLAKIGSGNNNTMLGKVYKMKDNYRQGEKGTIACIENIIYYRSSSLDPNPLICIDTDTLEEISQNFEINIYEPNALWVEGKKNEFEFPHTAHKDMNEVIEKKKNLGAEDKSNLRSTSASPMITDGRYIYIFSKWFDDIDVNLDRQAEDDDDEPGRNAKKSLVSIYGVDIYDPLDNMAHVKSVKLNQKKNETGTEIIDLLKQDTIYYTNGNIFVADVIKFNLTTGDEIERAVTFTPNLKICSYDLRNNVIWGCVLPPDKGEKQIYCYFNHSAKPVVDYPPSSEKYMPCSLDKILEYSEELLNIHVKPDEISMKTFLRENTLNILGLEDNSSKKFKNHALLNPNISIDLEIYKKSTQCWILSTIGKLSEYYGQVSDMRSANTDIEMGRIIAQATRRPYCVKLEPQTFEILIKFIDEFSRRFFVQSKINEDKRLETLDNYCLLSTVKILRTNLKCLSISKLDLHFFIKNKSDNPFLKMKEFIFKIFEIYHSNNRSDIIRALYEECKIIVEVSVNTLYPDYLDIIEILELEIKNFKISEYSKDIVKCVLKWMSNEENMKNILLKLNNENIGRIFKIFEIVSFWEIENFNNFIKSIVSLKNLPKYTTSDDEIIAFKFTSNMQIEILKSISKKLLNDNYEDIENEQILYQFSTIIFNHVVLIFRTIREFLFKVPNILEDDWESIYGKATDTEEEIIDTFKTAKETPVIETLTDFTKKKYKELWSSLLENSLLSNELLILKVFNFHIDSMSILSSNFIISSLMLNSFNEIIEEMNKIYEMLNQYINTEERKEYSDYKECIFESDHPYAVSQSKWFTLELSGEKEIFLDFDPLCYCRKNCAYIQMFTDTTMATHAFPQFTTINTNFPKETLHYNNSVVHLYFHSDACANSQNYWGFRVKVHNGKKTSSIKLDDKFTSIMRSVCWVSSKCSAQLIRGNFTKISSSTIDEDDAKYNNLLNSKLFAGGIDFDDIRKDNDKLLENIINIFENILPSALPNNNASVLTERKLLSHILNGDDPNINKILNLFQKKFSQEVVWAYIGGEQADRLCRAAFAALLRHSGRVGDFAELIDLFEIGEERESEVEDEDENEKSAVTSEIINADINAYTACNKNIFLNPKSKSLYKKWQAACRMRTWLVEKKKNVDEALEKSKPFVKSSDSLQKEESNKQSENTSNEIMNKIIDQIIIKAKFLLKLNPSPAFSANTFTDISSSVQLVRSSSLDDDLETDSWEKRLNQWKSIQKSKKVLKSIEEEANEKLTSLTSSVLMCLQSSISSKRLYNKIKVATIRAKGREIGLMTIKNTFEKISHSSLIQDLLCWFCASLRRSETKICHYLDGISGCGRYFEERVQNSFQDFVTLLISKLIKSEKIVELKSFIDSLMWKYSANDHKFLVDQSLFLILWGTYNEAIKQVWGKPIKQSFDLPEERSAEIESFEFTNNLIEVFEILSNICLDRVHSRGHWPCSTANYVNPGININIKFPVLEKQVSMIDDSHSESLVRCVLDVIFGEISKAVSTYTRNRGVSYRLWKQYEQYEEDKHDEKKKKENVKKITRNTRHSNEDEEHLNNSHDGSRDISVDNSIHERSENEEGEAEAQDPFINVKESSKKPNLIDEKDDKTYFYDATDLLSLYDELRMDYSKNRKNSSSSINNISNKIFITSNSLLGLIYNQVSEIYDSEFLNRLLLILYKCSIQHSDKILFSIANPLNFSSLLKLLRVGSTPNKILISKILQNVCGDIPDEILLESVDLLIHNPDSDLFLEKFSIKRNEILMSVGKQQQSEYNANKIIFVELILDYIEVIREKAWNKLSESSGCYIISHELISILRKLLYVEQWNSIINLLFVNLFDKDNRNHLRREIVLSIFGGDYVGLCNGANVKIKSEPSLYFDFIKNEFVEHFNHGTIIGFSDKMDDVWNTKVTKDAKKKKINTSVNLTPMNTIDNQVAVLIHDSIVKDEFNILDITPRIFYQHEIIITQPEISFDYLRVSQEKYIPLLSFVVYDKSNSSEMKNFKVSVLRFLDKFTQTAAAAKKILSLEESYLMDVMYVLLLNANKPIQFNSNYLNLHLLEEKRFRILNYCSERGFSLAEIPKISITFRKPNYLIIRLNSENLLNLCINFTGVLNYENLLKVRNDDFYAFCFDADINNDSSVNVILTPPESFEKYLSYNIGNNKIIITHSMELKNYESKVKKLEGCSFICIEQDDYLEIESFYDNLIRNKRNLEQTNEYKEIFKEKDAKSCTTELLINELENFGFEKDLIIKEIRNNKDNVDINILINNLIESKEKRKDENEITVQDLDNDIAVDNEIENEPKNDCFNTTETDLKTSIPEYFEEMMIRDSDDNSLLFKSFKSLNDKILIFYSRRIALNLLHVIIEENSYENLLSKLPINLIINLLKLITHEGLFTNSINLGSDLLLQVKNVLIKIYHSNQHKLSEIAKNLTQSTLSDLQTIMANKKKTPYELVTRNEELITQKPLIFFSIWNLMIINEYSKVYNVEYPLIIDILAGIIPKLSENKQIRWFILDLLIQLVNKLSNKIKEDPELLEKLSHKKQLKELPNVNSLRILLDKSISKESKKNLSKRSQMICEFLIYINEIDNKISNYGKIEDNSNSNSDIKVLLDSEIKRDNFINEFENTFDMMKGFFDKKYLKYLAWIEMNPEISNSSKLTFESPHLYPKAPHTFLLTIPNTLAMEVNINSDTLIDYGDSLMFSLDKNGRFPVECFSNRNSKKTFTIQSGHVFVHFPANYLTEVYSFGANSYTRLGQTGADITSPKLIESLSNVMVKDCAIGDSFVSVLTDNGELYSCGSSNTAGIKQTTNTFVKASGIASAEKINSEGISVFGVYCGSVIISTNEGSLYSIGANSFGQLGQSWTNPVTEITSMNFIKKIKQIAIGETHSMILSVEGDVYHVGNNDYYQNGEVNATRNNTPKLLSLNVNKSLICEMVTCGEYFSIFLMKDINSGKKKLYSTGWSKNGRTGTGKDEEYHGFKAISSSELENLEFKSIFSSKQSSLAITTTGKLFAWGYNQRGQLGLGNYNDTIEPTLVTFFDGKYEVEDASISSEHTLVIAKDIHKGNVSVFGFGDTSSGRLGESITQKTEKKDTMPTPIKISYFEGKNAKNVYTGPRASIVICRLKPYENLRDIHTNTKCNICEKSPIVGKLFSDITDEFDSNKIYCNDCIKNVEIVNGISPRLMLRSPLKDYSLIFPICKKYYSTLMSKDNEELISSTILCKNCKEIIKINLKGAFVYLENKNKNYLCNNCIDIYPTAVTTAKVYLKIFKFYKDIDIINITNFYDNSISYGYKFTVTPILNEKGCESVIEKMSTSFANFVEDLNDFNKFEVYEQLVDLLNNIVQKSERSIYTYQPKELTFKKEELSVRNGLEKCTPELLRKMFVILKILNSKVKDLMVFIDFSKVLKDNQRLSFHFNKITPLIFWDTKNELIKYYLEKTAAEHEVCELKINRMKVRRFIEKGKPDHTGEHTIFGLIFQLIKHKSFKIFRKKEGGNNNKMFNVTFVGEASIDAGGPYREALTQACSELQSSALPLFIPSPNQKNESGLNREKWIINPSANLTSHLEMYKTFGGLLGYAIRTGEFLNLDLPSIFWKQILETIVDRKDLELIDRYTIQCLDDIINIHKKGVTSDTFTFYVDQKFTTCLSDGSEVELTDNGKNLQLEYVDRVKYCELVEKIRLEESKIQIAAIRSGLERVIPIGLLKLLSWKELETLVCGKPILDVDLLRENTVYRGCTESDQVVQFLWKCLEEFSAEERSMYLRFVWGRSRLPLTSKDFSMKHRIEILHHNNPDVALPTSHTCFFSLEIPKYSSYELLKEKLKYAISNCQAIDTDGRPYEIWQDEE